MVAAGSEEDADSCWDGVPTALVVDACVCGVAISGAATGGVAAAAVLAALFGVAMPPAMCAMQYGFAGILGCPHWLTAHRARGLIMADSSDLC